MMKKISQIFLFDLILSMVIVLVSVSLIALYYSNVTSNEDISTANNNFVEAFSKTKINNLNNDEIRNLFLEGKIRNIENTIAQQVSEFYFNNSEIEAINLTKIIAKDYFSEQVNVQIILIDGGTSVTLYNQTIKRKEDAQVVSTFDRNIFGFYENNPYGPYTITSEVWT